MASDDRSRGVDDDRIGPAELTDAGSDLIDLRVGVARVPAAEIEAAVIGQIRGMLRAPEVVMSTWRAAQPNCDGPAEDEVREALAALYPLWAELFPAEQARIVQLLIERVDIGTDGLKLRFRDKGLAQMVEEVGMISGKSRKAA